MTPIGLAQTHALAFGGKGWPARDFERYLNDPKVMICGDDTCYVVFRLAGPEAEILTLATRPDKQGKGRATQMLTAALNELTTAAVEEVFLEVAEDNTAAIALYNRNGFTAFATRSAYYANSVAAICMKAVLSPSSST